MLTPFFPGTHDCVDHAEVGDVEEKLEDEEEGEDEEVDENTILEDDFIQFEEEDLIKLEELFEGRGGLISLISFMPTVSSTLS